MSLERISLNSGFLSPLGVIYDRIVGSSTMAILSCFLLGFSVRLIPELLSWPHPIGFDTIYYGARIKSGVIWHHWSEFFSRTWLLYAILIPIYNLIKGDPFILLKFTAPVLYGLNACGIYYFARKGLNWDTKRSLLAVFFFVFQLASLRISWDLYRNTLGLGILLFTLPFIKDLEDRRNFMFFMALSVLVVLGHELASVILFAVISGVMLSGLLKGEYSRVRRIMTATLPALTLFLTSVYFRVFPIRYQVYTNIIRVHDAIPARVGGIFFLVNYMRVISPYQFYQTYVDLVLHVLSLFSLLYLLSLSLVLLGVFRNRVLDYWTLLLLVGSFSALFSPFCALNWWDRWMDMLVCPFTFYAVNGIFRLFRLRCRRGLRLGSIFLIFSVLLLMVLSGFAFMSVRFENGGPFYSPYTIAYFPSTMLHNTVLLQDVGGTIEAFGWLNKYMDDNSVVLVQHAFINWAKTYLNNNLTILYYIRNIDMALNESISLGFSKIYLIWWKEDIGWYGLNVPQCFTIVNNFGRIAVFEYAS